jgi:hypothetical protein
MPEIKKPGNFGKTGFLGGGGLFAKTGFLGLLDAF